MHKNAYHAKSLIGNWQEERSTEKYEDDNIIANSHLPNPCYNKYVPISKDYGDLKDYKKVSILSNEVRFEIAYIPYANNFC